MRLLSRLSCYRGKLGTVEVNSVKLPGDGWEVKHDDGKCDRGGDRLIDNSFSLMLNIVVEFYYLVCRG